MLCDLGSKGLLCCVQRELFDMMLMLFDASNSALVHAKVLARGRHECGERSKDCGI